MRTIEDVARRMVWWKAPAGALVDSGQLVARVMAYGALSDVQVILRELGPQALADSLQNAPPGIFDVRSWRYWHVVLGLPESPRPMRILRQ